MAIVWAFAFSSMRQPCSEWPIDWRRYRFYHVTKVDTRKQRALHCDLFSRINSECRSLSGFTHRAIQWARRRRRNKTWKMGQNGWNSWEKRLSELEKKIAHIDIHAVTNLSELSLHMSDDQNIKVEGNSIIHHGAASHQTCVFTMELSNVCVLSFYLTFLLMYLVRSSFVSHLISLSIMISPSSFLLFISVTSQLELFRMIIIVSSHTLSLSCYTPLVFLVYYRLRSDQFRSRG